MIRQSVFSRRGQSIIEYLVVAVAVIAAIVGFRTFFADSIGFIGGEAAENVTNAATQLDGAVPGPS